jgi:uncharacterized caspase-like protein
MASYDGDSSRRRKLALVIGNGNYSRPSNRLTHSINNAIDVSDLLNRINFNVTTYTDANTEMKEMIVDFAKTINQMT